MKVVTRVLAVAAVLAMASAANADTLVWFSASAPAGGGGIDNPGGPGQVLQLNCDDTVTTTCSWTITLAFQNAQGDELLAGWAVDLDTRESISGKVGVSNFAYASNNFVSHAPAVPTLGNGPMLIRNADGLDLSGGGSAGGVLASFTLTKHKTAGDLNSTDIYMTSGGVEWAGQFGTYPNINGVFEGGAAGNDLGNVIHIRNFPEPSSIALLGLGALALIRRR